MLMARLTDKQRLQRVVEFVAGLHHPDARRALQARGFTSQEAEEGFRLLRAAIEAFHSGAAEPPAPPDTLALLDAWENRWLPIIRAALTRHHPELARSLFLNLRQTRGPALLLTLPTLLDRLDSLNRGRSEAQHRASALLTQRGLTSDVIQEARQLLHDVARPAAADATSDAPKLREPTLKSLWSWYLEWSETARAVIHDRRLLKALGFSSSSG
jgi:hypothetical protein